MRTSELLLRSRGYGSGVVGQETVAKDRQTPQQLAVTGRKPIDPGRDEALDRMRERVDIAPGLQGAEQFDQEQGVSGTLCRPGPTTWLGSRGLIARGRDDQGLGLRLGQRLQLDAGNLLPSPGPRNPPSPGRRVRMIIQGWRSSPNSRPASSSREASSIQWVSSMTISVRAVTTASSNAPTAATVRAGRN